MFRPDPFGLLPMSHPPLPQPRSPKRVLLEGPMVPDSTTESRFRALAALIPETEIFNSTGACAHRNRLLNVLGHRLYCTPANVQYSLRFLRTVRRFQPEVVWIDKGRWIWPAVLNRVRKSGAQIVHYNTDDALALRGYLWLHRWGLRPTDLYLTTNRFNVSELSARYGLTSMRVGMGHDHESRRAPESESLVSKVTLYDVVFVGHWEPHTEARLALLKEAGLNVGIWGGNWKRARHAWMRQIVPLPISDYVQTLRASKLVFCSLSRMNRNESTGRSFEIPALGACLFGEYTAEHGYLYRDGIEAVFFRTDQEMMDKARRYCSDSAARERIVEEGHRRCLALGVSWQQHMEREWALVVRWYADGKLKLTSDDDVPFWTGYRIGQPFTGFQPDPLTSGSQGHEHRTQL